MKAMMSSAMPCCRYYTRPVTHHDLLCACEPSDAGREGGGAAVHVQHLGVQTMLWVSAGHAVEGCAHHALKGFAGCALCRGSHAVMGSAGHASRAY